MGRALLIGLVVLCVCASLGSADTWVFPAKLTTERFEFGKTKVVLDVDGTKHSAWPPHTLSIYADRELLAKYKDVGFEHLYASKDKRFFLGVSNSGVPGTAFVIFDADGNLIREVKHRYMPADVYTDKSATVIRKWFESQRTVEFKVKSGRLDGVLVWGTTVKRYDLLEPDLGLEADGGVEMLKGDGR